MSTSTPRRALTRPRPALTSGISTASSPNLLAAYNSLPNSALNGLRATGILGRKSSLSALTQGSLASIPDASEGYGLSTVLDVDPTMIERMTPQTPGGGEFGDIEVGDSVDVPGSMYGTVRFVGNVQGKKGTFAGVELSEEFASRGKNSGDVDG
jgi:CAP-Gly domain